MAKQMKYIRTVVEVEGKGRFPFDMLRYDSCAVIEGANQITDRDMRTIKLARFSPEGTKATAARWNSFGWGVVSDTGK